MENAMDASAHNMLAQRIVARGLSEPADSRSAQILRFRVVTAVLQPRDTPAGPGKDIELEDVLTPLVEAMNDLAEEPKKTIFHLMPPPATPAIIGARAA
jgi:hypothetical protein